MRFLLPIHICIVWYYNSATLCQGIDRENLNKYNNISNVMVS